MPETTQVSWIKCQANINPTWCGFQAVDLSSEHLDGLDGVYVIWHGGQNPATVRVGQGNIRDRLTAHREDRQVTAYSQFGLFVTWASVAASSRDGVERFLSEKLAPKVGSRFPDVPSIAVNLPW